MFDPKSRYYPIAPVFLNDSRGRAVAVTPPAPAPAQGLLGIHSRREGERADHLAALYLADPEGYWRIAEMNDAMTAEALTELREVAIPGRGQG